ncbi:MarR family transcriptional regulator [Actinacidiphila glaucinigra]|uniref:MarR family winged helix-turn-helix transcriptional regulator n=1 Tax=Actinacidiphila glaucinigra TaxID=235986 RepID=UPI002DD9BDEF|nr:MarR family transcriptional regulator [Actinacidiphila glaucinigra]WSD57723.1 MarR family transcriptional regulator [Actinacidiphila glaucinigra]
MHNPHWLTEEEQRVWRLFIAATRKLNAHLDQQLRQNSATPATYFEILVHLSEAPDRSLRMATLAERCFSTRSKLSHAVTALEKSGYVSRKVADGDGRGSVALLTDAGLDALETAAVGHVEDVRRHVFDVLTPEQQRALGGVSSALLNALIPDCAKVRQDDV